MNTPTPTPTSILQIDKLHFAYPGQPALFASFSGSIGPGITLLHGDTGSGKSTLLQVLAGSQPADGSLTLAGTSLVHDPEAYRRKVFYCDPATAAFDHMSGHACAASFKSSGVVFNSARWQALVEGFALAPHLDKQMFMLSTGSKRKVWLAAALASDRALTLLDEPTSGLDARSIRCLWATLTDLAQQPDRAIVVASAALVEQVPLAATLVLPLR